MATEGRRGVGTGLKGDQSASRTPISADFGRQIRESRVRQGISQEELAARAQLDRTFVGRVERGEFRITLENADALAQACGEVLWEVLKLCAEECVDEVVEP
ncbi:helix-turn-helix domain-containing protein [Deinococcus planocerae]|uniref:helix-turn-helix domain-containing protein n=1 Tax=Deinococcus planocerae TaxID=1737569 RepID=UPI000C7EE33C|nr:helix-turn-helix transcriptional regulator [Deinococcus planocerae]